MSNILLCFSWWTLDNVDYCSSKINICLIGLYVFLGDKNEGYHTVLAIVVPWLFICLISLWYSSDNKNEEYQIKITVVVLGIIDC